MPVAVVTEHQTVKLELALVPEVIVEVFLAS